MQADYLLFEAIDRHGPLPTHYLHEYTRHVRRDYSNLQYRLTKFYNGDRLGPYLTRPPQQFESYEARYQHAVYALSPRAKVALAERGTLNRHAPPRAAPFVHQLMTACVAASIELGAMARGIRYISREEIFARLAAKSCGNLPRGGAALRIEAAGRAIIPDDLFGLEYPSGGFRFFALEADRNTESIERRAAGQSSFGQKIRTYGEILRTQAHIAHWGLPNLTVLTVTTNAVHAQRLCAVASAVPEYGDRFAFAVETSFGANWRVPRDVLRRLLDTPWITPAGQKDIGRP